MVYKPLDLSFLNARTSAEGESIRNTAAMIMANAGWSKPSQQTLAEIKKANDKIQADAKAASRQTFLSSVFDALSTPLYGVANALDEALAGHQSDPNDSVLEDIAKTAGGVFTGAGRGIGAGLRGASGILDVLPGVDISDEWQSDRSDKTHFSDVAIRKMTGMGTEEAMAPENWEKIKPFLQEANDKSIWDKTIFEMAVPDDLEDPKAREKYFRNEMLTGIPVDIGADPLNFILGIPGGIGRAAKTTEAATEGLNDARAMEGINDSILGGLNSKAGREFEAKGSLTAPPPVAGISEAVTPGTKLDISSIGAGSKASNFKDLSGLGRRETVQPKGSSLTPRDVKNVAGQIGKWAAMGDKGWIYRAGQYLNTVDDGMKWDRTFDFLDKANKAVTGKGLRHDPARMVPVLIQRMNEDIAAAGRGTGTVERRLLNTIDDVVIRPNGPRLKVPEARLANQVVRKFEGEILGRKRAPGTGEGLARAIASGANVRYSGPQQARMWNQITSSLKFADARKFDKAVRVLRSVEDYFITKGVIPHSAAKTAESVPLRLSQVAEAIGPQVLGKSPAFITGILRGDAKALAQLTPDEIEALKALRASEAAATAVPVQRGLSEAKVVADQIVKAPLSLARKNELTADQVKRLKEFTAAQGGGDVGARVVGEYMGSLLGRSNPVNAALATNRLATEAWLGSVAKGVKKAPRGKGASKVGGSVSALANDPQFLRSVTNAITRASNLPSPTQLGRLVGPAAKIKDWLGARFNAAYGVQDMRPIFLRENSSAMSTVGRRAKLLNELGRRFDPKDSDLWHEAFTAAQRNGVTSGRVAELQSEIAKVMENLFGGTGLRSGAISDSTIVGRNRLLLDELNSNLKRFGLGQFTFQAKKVTDAAGVTHDFSKGLDWMKSWEAWNVTDPYKFLHQVQNAIEHTVREKTMFDEIASRFGSPAKHKDVKYGVNHPRLAGYYFTKEGAAQAKTFVRMLDEVSTPNSKQLQYFDHVLSKLKASLTIYIPGHHMTNLIGDMYYNWIAGVNKPIRYEQAMKVMLAQKGRYGEFAEIGSRNVNSLENLTGPEALQRAIAQSMTHSDAGLRIPTTGGKAIVTMQNGTRVTADMIYTAAFREGILPSARVLEDVTSETTSILDKFRPLGGRGQRAVHEVAEIRDHIPRLAQFIDGLAKSKGSFSSAVTSSARSVRKWHPDGTDLTKFERTVMKRVFPFYSWTRKAIPLAIESAVFAGPKVMAYPRLMEAIALMNGNDPESNTTNPFPTDQMFPDWVRDRGIGPIAGGPGSYMTVNPSTPVLDTLALLGHPGQSSIDMLNPMGKVPIETMQGQTLGRNVPIGDSNQEWADYFAKQIPGISHAGRASGQFGVSDSTKDEGFPNWINILNLMTGAKAVDTGKYQKSAQFDLRDFLKKKAQQQGP